MAKTIKTQEKRQVIGGVFSSRKKADEAIQAFRALGVRDEDINITVTINDTDRKGKVRVVIHNVAKSAPIMQIFDEHEAIYNLDGSRNVRDDVAGLTLGMMAGATAGGVAGTLLAGPLGSALGATAGAVLGSGVGATLGKVAEDGK